MRSFRQLSLLLLMLVACGGDDEEQRPQQPATRPTARADSVERQPVYPEAEAAQILRAINENEIAVSQIARQRSQNEDILRYAAVMIADHDGMTQLLDSILPPISDSVNAESRALRAAGLALADSLGRIEGGFNNSYVTTQIAAHEQALLLLDTALIPSARNPQLKKLLRDLRPAVVAHLQRAQQIWAERQASAAATATARAQTAPATPTPAPAAPAQPDTVPGPTTTDM